MEESVFVKCEPAWPSDTEEEPSNFKQNSILPSDNQLEIKEDPHANVADPISEEVDIKMVKEHCSDEDEKEKAYIEECDTNGGSSHGAYQLYTENGGTKDRPHFLIELGEQIVEENLGEAGNGMRSPQVGRPSLKPTPARFTERHFPDFIPSSDQKKCVTRRCRVCYDKGVRKESRYWCPDCMVGLCVAPCFKAYHCE